MKTTDKSRSQDLLDAASCRVAVVKIRELKRNRPTALILNLLFSLGTQGEDRARLSLFRRCKRALRSYPGRGKTRGLFVLPEGLPHPDAPQDVEEFINIEINKLERVYGGRSRRSVLLVALEGKFRGFLRILVFRFIDVLRKYGPRGRSRPTRQHAAEIELLDGTKREIVFSV